MTRQGKEFKISTDILVRFSDADAMGHVNNARYLSYFEQARIEYYKRIKKFDLRRGDAANAFDFIVAEIGVKFLTPAYIDETLTVAIRIAELRTKAFRMEYEIRDKKSRRLIATGYSVQVMYNYKKQKTLPISPSLRRKILRLEGQFLG